MKKIKLTNGLKGQKGRPAKHDISFMRNIAKRYNQGNESLSQIAKEFNIPNQYVSRWAKQFSCELAGEPMITPMTEQEEKDIAGLQKQLTALKEKLEYEQMKNFALETLVDLAKSELGIDLRKNSGAKQPKE
jgi:transposase